MNILAIETSTAIGSLAIARQGRVIEEVFLPAVTRQCGRILVPELMALLGRAGLKPDQLDLIAVGIGPGGFTGLRVGVTCAKTLAWSTGTPLAAVDSFEAIAQNLPTAERVAVLADAQRRGVLLGVYHRTPLGGHLRADALRIVGRDVLPESLAGIEFVSGPGLGGAEIAFRGGAVAAPASHWPPRAGVVARLGQLYHERGELADPLALVPHYVRQPAAQEQQSGQRGA